MNRHDTNVIVLHVPIQTHTSVLFTSHSTTDWQPLDALRISDHARSRGSAAQSFESSVQTGRDNVTYHFSNTIMCVASKKSATGKCCRTTQNSFRCTLYVMDCHPHVALIVDCPYVCGSTNVLGFLQLCFQFGDHLCVLIVEAGF